MWLLYRLVPALTLIIGLALPAAAQSRRGELRGVWVDAGRTRDWPAVVKSLEENGFNALFANFSTGAVADYPSEVLEPRDPSHAAQDELARAVQVAGEHGIELHVWRIDWALYGASQELMTKLEAADRLQRNHRGQLGREDPAVGVDWLCPSHPENGKLEKDAVLELVRRYDVAGVQLDYMRFPGHGYCFCDRCRKRFEQDVGVEAEQWPDDVLEGGALADRWMEWRRQLLTEHAGEVANAVHAARADCYVSLAAWPELEAGRESYGQDWVTWVHEGVVDFVCPMDYTETADEVARLVREQVKATRGEVPLYAGLGAYKLKSSWSLIQQVKAARNGGADGFVLFAYGVGDLTEWLPDLRATVTAADPDPAPHWSPPARFAFSGPAFQPPAESVRVVAGARLETEIAVGWRRQPAEGEEPGAAEAGVMLRRMIDPRKPVSSYDDDFVIADELGDDERIGGRLLAETPSGRALLSLGAFDTDSQFERTLRFPAPQGPFRIAVYGSVKSGSETRDYVARGPLLVGTDEEQLRAEAIRSELDRFMANACGRPEIAQLSGLSATIQVKGTGPGGGQWWLRFLNGECAAGAGAAEKPDITFTASAEDLLALARGEAEPRLLSEAGRLRASGDEELLRRVAEILGHI